MTIQEFIELVKGTENYSFSIPGEGCTFGKTVWLKDIVETLEKQVPKKPYWEYDDEPLCPNCDEPLEYGCDCDYGRCGQKIDWGVK